MMPMTCDLGGGVTAIFDVPDTTVDDFDETWRVFNVFVEAVGA